MKLWTCYSDGPPSKQELWALRMQRVVMIRNAFILSHALLKWSRSLSVISVRNTESISPWMVAALLRGV